MARRKPLAYTLAQIELLASFGLTRQDVAALLGLHRSTLWRRQDIRNALLKGSLRARARLKTTQMQVAMGSPAEYDEDGKLKRVERKPNITMLIWLGKQYLGQTDRGTREDGGIGHKVNDETTDELAMIQSDPIAAGAYERLTQRLVEIEDQQIGGSRGGNGRVR